MDRLRDHSCFWYFRVSTPTCNILKTQTLSVHAGLFECFHNPPNNDMDYKIFGVCMWFLLFLLLRVYTHVYLTEEASKSKAQSLSIAMDYKCIYIYIHVYVAFVNSFYFLAQQSVSATQAWLNKPQGWIVLLK